MVAQEELDAMGPWLYSTSFGENAHTKGVWDANSYLEMLMPYFDEDLTGKTVIDCGCNAGLIALGFAQRGANVIGLEPFDRYFKQAQFVKKFYGLDNLNIYQDSVFNLHHYPKADYILCLGLLYHFRYYQLLLDYLAQLDFERIFFGTQLMPGNEYQMRNRYMFQKPGTVPYWGWEPTEAMFKRLLTDSGYTDIVDIKGGEGVEWHPGLANNFYVACKKGAPLPIDVESISELSKRAHFFV